ncbi:hypothetical protein ACN4EG_12270 [Alkalinema pantanalense CENA528]|uniref:hypothetical protein n=1 Tax=Alkalinema pantanalense TaxID=1620705 RepID=UPI003D6EF19B
MNLPIKRIERTGCLGYRSTIAMQISAKTQQSATSIAQTIVEHFNCPTDLWRASLDTSEDTSDKLCLQDEPNLAPLWMNIPAQWDERGGIVLEINDRVLAHWLALLLQNPTSTFRAIGEASDASLRLPDSLPEFCLPQEIPWLVHWVHARCHQLLRAGISQGLPQFLPNATQPGDRLDCQRKMIPDLGIAQEERVTFLNHLTALAEGSLQFPKIADLLLQPLVDSWDNWEVDLPLKKRLKGIDNLCQAFHRFDRVYQVANHQTASPDRAFERQFLHLLVYWIQATLHLYVGEPLVEFL